MLVLKKNDLIRLIESKYAMTGIVGLGYLGLPLLLCCGEAGYTVIGFDISEDKVSSLSKGKIYIEYISDDPILTYSSSTQELKRSGTFQATCDFSQALEADILIPYVPSLLNKYREPDLHHVV